jgi:hypothetical protein
MCQILLSADGETCYHFKQERKKKKEQSKEWGKKPLILVTCCPVLGKAKVY